ncbi:gastrin/cholecystokinin type B receptor isoform X1 [Anomalospiza imberbis]|uniref:gastrin/cholecystokinin type B receptor isoform X1 n=1 Tax=Anomalospiza imberbis TaxID=187417 RepID=UPI00358ED2D4
MGAPTWMSVPQPQGIEPRIVGFTPNPGSCHTGGKRCTHLMGLHRARAGHVGAPVSQCLGLCWGAFGVPSERVWGATGLPWGCHGRVSVVASGVLSERLWGAPGVPVQRRAPLPAELDVAVRVVLYVLIFVLSVGGNALVVAVLALNRRLRTVTNCFLLSLALSDLLLALCCMPFTLLPGLMGAFIFGDVVCKLVAYLMGVSVAVSTFSLVAIAIERYSAICNPLQSRAWQTRSHACRVIAGTWALAALLMLPYAVYSTTRPAAPRPPPAQCTHHWPSERVRQVWYVLLLLVLFFIPGVVMTVAYGLISRELYRGIRFELDVKRGVAAQRGIGGDPAPTCDDGDGCYLQLSRPGAALELRALGAAAQQDRARINSSGAQLAAKRRVIRMLVVIVAMFFLCWLPIFAANTWRAFAPRAAQRALSGTPIAFIHLLSYTSACANPLIYCFMNRRFRKAFGATCAGWGCRRACPRRPPEDEPPMASASLSKFSYTTVSSLGPP